MTYSLYNNFTLEDAANIGARFKAICIGHRGVEQFLAINGEYEIEITPRILPMSPLCKVLLEDGRTLECHLDRFQKVEKL